MSKKIKISQEDMDAFAQAIKGAKPLVKKDRIKLSKRNPTISRPKETDFDKLELMETQDVEDVTGHDFISYKRAGIPNKTLRKLRKGQYNVDAILDLHGKSVENAKAAVEKFLLQCLRAHIRVILIIHGKGHHSQVPILKNKLNLWLRDTSIVLAFCSATPSQGSRGAIYVLLKDNTEENLFE